MHVRERTTTKPSTWKRSALRWLPTFFGFPLGGFVAEHVSGPVDGLAAALVGGAITGVILGAVQSWGLGTNGPPARQWIAATGVGFTVGLGVGAAAVDYGTSMGDLVVQGAICGLAIGAAQAVGAATAARPPRLRLGPDARARCGHSAGRSPPRSASTSRASTRCSAPAVRWSSPRPPSSCRCSLATAPTAPRRARREPPRGLRHRPSRPTRGRPPRRARPRRRRGEPERSRRRSPAPQVVGGDVTDPVFAKDVTRDASTVYFCLNAPNYHRWPQEFPPLQDAVVGAADRSRCRASSRSRTSTRTAPRAERR